MHANHSRLFQRTGFTVCFVALTGCANLSVHDLNPFAGPGKFREATAHAPAVEILALWQPAEGRGLTGMPTRGFAGQIMFFTNGDPAPVKVNGDVRVYLFDDLGSPEEQSRPLHQFDFAPDVWNLHLQRSMLGPSYQVFIPYVRKDHHQAKCALSLQLKATDGPTIYSKMVSIVLPGPIKEQSADKKKAVGTSSTQASAMPGAAAADNSEDEGLPAADSKTPLTVEHLASEKTTAVGSTEREKLQGFHVLVEQLLEQRRASYAAKSGEQVQRSPPLTNSQPHGFALGAVQSGAPQTKFQLQPAATSGKFSASVSLTRANEIAVSNDGDASALDESGSDVEAEPESTEAAPLILEWPESTSMAAPAKEAAFADVWRTQSAIGPLAGAGLH